MPGACRRRWLIFPVLLLSVFLAGCETKEDSAKEGTERTETQTEANQDDDRASTTNKASKISQGSDSASEEEVKESQSIFREDTYWVAVQYTSHTCECEEGEERQWQKLPITQSENQLSWWLDLFLFSDGTIRLRDVSGNNYDGMAMEGRWAEGESGEITITSGHRIRSLEEMEEWELPILWLVNGEDPCEAGMEGMLAMGYFGGCIYFQRAKMPEKDFHLCMADLRGDWTFVSGETDGYVYEMEDGILTSLTFEEGNYQTEAVHTSFTKFVGEITEFRASVIYREEPLYEECGNKSWSVELKPQSLSQGDDAYYATLLEEDTLLLQHFYTIEGIRFVSYETYTRGSEAKDALILQKKLQSVLTEHPANTLFCIGTNLYVPTDPGVETLMEAARLTEEADPDTMMLLCPEYVKLQVTWNGEVIHETELGHRNTELLLLKIPQENGTCQFTFTSDFENWYTLDISRETFDTPMWISVLDPG